MKLRALIPLQKFLFWGLRGGGREEYSWRGKGVYGLNLLLQPLTQKGKQAMYWNVAILVPAPEGL